MVMAHKGKVNWETKVYDRGGLGGGGPEEGAAGTSAGTHIWETHTDTGPAIKSLCQGVNSFLQ